MGFTDDSGQRVRFARPLKRIISLYGAHTENLFSLGLDDEIIGVSTNESYPPAALGKPAFSYRDDPERLLAARPDLVLVRPMIMRGHSGLAASLRRAGVTVVSLQPSSVPQMLAYWQKLGQLPVAAPRPGPWSSAGKPVWPGSKRGWLTCRPISALGSTLSPSIAA